MLQAIQLFRRRLLVRKVLSNDGNPSKTDCDYLLLDMNGVEILRRLRSEGVNVLF